MTNFRALDTVLVRQAVIAGRLTDALSGEALAVPASIALAWRISGAVEFIDYPKPPGIKPGAYFYFAGTPEAFFPALEAGESLECRLTARAPGYQDADASFILSRAQVTPSERSETHAGFEIRLQKLDAPVREQDIALLPTPLGLAGRVIEDNDLDSPVSGAAVSVIDPAAGGSAISDARGYFRIDDLPVVRKIKVQVVSGGETLTEEFVLDYGRRINERTFSLSA